MPTIRSIKDVEYELYILQHLLLVLFFALLSRDADPTFGSGALIVTQHVMPSFFRQLSVTPKHTVY
jgi:hypothetical protein